jgi:hypothetical protein
MGWIELTWYHPSLLGIGRAGAAGGDAGNSNTASQRRQAPFEMDGESGQAVPPHPWTINHILTTFSVRRSP